VTGLIPAWRIYRAEAGEVLGSTRVMPRGDGLRAGLLVAEVAFTVLLLVGSGLLLKSFVRLSAVDPGFRTDHLVAMDADLSALGESAGAERVGFYSDVRERALSLPGVAGAAWNRDVPVREAGQAGAVMIEGRPKPAPSELDRLYANWHVIGPEYFRTLGVALYQGRDFSDGDGVSAPQVAIVNASFVRFFFPDGRSALGQRFFIGLDSAKPITIVGVVADTRPLTAAIMPELYLPFRQHLGMAGRIQLTMRVAGEAGPVVAALRQFASQREPAAALQFATMNEELANSIAAPRFRTQALILFAGIALSLALIGMYGVISYVTQARTREVGLRMALGAQPSDVLRQFLGQGALWSAAGLALGLTGAVLLRGVLAEFLYEVPASDGPTYAGAAALLLASALGACFVPAWRATRQDPAQVLRQE